MIPCPRSVTALYGIEPVRDPVTIVVRVPAAFGPRRSVHCDLLIRADGVGLELQHEIFGGVGLQSDLELVQHARIEERLRSEPRRDEREHVHRQDDFRRVVRREDVDVGDVGAGTGDRERRVLMIGSDTCGVAYKKIASVAEARRGDLRIVNVRNGRTDASSGLRIPALRTPRAPAPPSAVEHALKLQRNRTLGRTSRFNALAVQYEHMESISGLRVRARRGPACRAGLRGR